MIAQNGIDWRLEPFELIGKTAFQDGPYATVHNIAAYEHQVRILNVHQVYPSAQFTLAVMIAYVQIAGQDYSQRLVKWLVCMNGQFLTVFVMVVYASGCHKNSYHPHYTYKSYYAVMQIRFWKDLADRCNIGQKEYEKQIHECHQPRITNIIKECGKPDRETLRIEESGHHDAKPQHKKARNSKFHGPSSRSKPPQVPDLIRKPGHHKGK